MKITKQYLKKLIKEELTNVLNEDVGGLVTGALEDAKLPADTKLVGYGVHGGRITLVPEDPKLFAQNWRPGSKGIHTQYVMIVPETDAPGMKLEDIVQKLEGMGLKRMRIHTGAGYME